MEVEGLKYRILYIFGKVIPTYVRLVKEWLSPSILLVVQKIIPSQLQNPCFSSRERTENNHKHYFQKRTKMSRYLVFVIYIVTNFTIISSALNLS